jgi:hypothetical protein
MRENRPTVWIDAWSVPPVAWLEELGQGTARIRLDTAEWVVWLDVRKEGRQRGGSYWRVYRRCGAKVRKVYLGRTKAVTNERLAAIARAFLSEESVRQETEPLPVPPY